jgi:hypothetical protein
VSPTYWTASQLKTAAQANGWQFIRSIGPTGPWGMRRGNLRVLLQERRDGGLLWISLTRIDSVGLAQQPRINRLDAMGV